ncbi:hypothetical protein CPAST_c24190 [Clostridium pasteurianum DSM 525 = ATCC 6013]|uniref:Phage protein n=1 Tax=Clostridium pasteurianum DSM 525 = ATCC 6013 TaxID=1262449 RepID=A0A0H3J4R6_CLOPA|nr:hypothetical protein [Clostridium pasteurianum]AJA48489.1 hypothetical protein CPAST_c24190 [Clostridium pasteurianum DSM 525 = ATCC 6013]AJA52477.1 hypothetical protein CLPA_c24190 [Clostridium pasteurianum DSM 525 = ATCC 6013]AOZ75729.1 hypothetical protein AQ983_11755 [Clostridium pasteurianum DSM 525 = ATCC 6013]AOZ79525.1 hypothetical protein AQ984_11750 [Clostridium pasteurianum]ELP60364.1 hypothetical protein F502_02727 [Clostridium pasteurianum DSM 525 = ATCC 6013]
MIKNYLVSVYNKEEGYKDEYGAFAEGDLKFIKSKFVDIQPYSTELLLKDYGYNIEVSSRIFDEIDDDIKIGTILQYKDEQYEVRKIINWDDYREVMCYGI